MLCFVPFSHSQQETMVFLYSMLFKRCLTSLMYFCLMELNIRGKVSRERTFACNYQAFLVSLGVKEKCLFLTKIYLLFLQRGEVGPSTGPMTVGAGHTQVKLPPLPPA